VRIYQPRPRRPLLVAQEPPGVDRFALGVALFSAFIFFATIMLVCAVVTLAVLVVRTEARWAQLAGWLAVGPGVLTPLDAQTPMAVFESPLPTAEPPAPAPTEPPTLEPMIEPTPVTVEEPTATPPVFSPVDTPTPEGPPTPDPALAPPIPPVAPEDVAYVTTASQLATGITNSLNTLNQLLVNPLVGDANWQQQALAQVAAMRQDYDVLITLQPPIAWSYVHTNLVSATQFCLSALYTAEQALYANDAQVVQQSANDLVACQPAVANASSQLNAGVAP
jgi:hypothetical protein